MKTKTSWHEKLHKAQDLPRVAKVTGKLSTRWGTKAGDTFVIPAPLEVDELIRRVKRGKLTTIDQMREALANKHGATIACPVTTGIFAWIAAHAAHEAMLAGRKRVTPYWRTLKSGGELNGKYPGGVEELARRLRAEGHRVVQRRKRYFVEEFAGKLARL